MEIEKVEYRVVQMEDDNFYVQRRVEGGPWGQASKTYEYDTAANACAVLRQRVKDQTALVSSMTVRKIVMIERDL